MMRPTTGHDACTQVEFASGAAPRVDKISCRLPDQRQVTATLEHNVRMFRNMRLRDRAASRGLKAQHEREKEPKEYPLSKGQWSSCDESENEVELSAVAMAF